MPTPMAKTQSVSVEAPAKINLYLDVLGRRENGYHNIESVMQTVSLHDVITVEADTPRRGEQSIAVEASADELPCDGSNLAHRAALAFFSALNTVSYNIRIHIVKNIPIAAGLAGGSTNAAAVFSALNRLYGEPFSLRELEALGLRLGADIPFCLRRGTAAARGVGEILDSLPTAKDIPTVIAVDGEGVLTPWAYRQIDLMDLRPRYAFEPYLDAVRAKDIPSISKNVYNIFDEAVFPARPRAKELKERLLHCGAVSAAMSGSGPAVFGLFSDEAAAKDACQALTAAGIKAFLCKTI